MPSTGPIAEIVNGGEYLRPCSSSTLPEQITADVGSTRWSMILSLIHILMGFAPADDPKIAVAVVVHNVDLYGSFAAGPIMTAIMKEALQQ